MKNKLFAVATVLFIYFVFVLAFTMADNQGKISQVVSTLGLSDAAAIASPATSQESVFTTGFKGNLIDPVPEPSTPKPKPSRLDLSQSNLIDPVPEPSTPKPKPSSLNNVNVRYASQSDLIDPVPEPTTPKPKPTRIAQANLDFTSHAGLIDPVPEPSTPKPKP